MSLAPATERVLLDVWLPGEPMPAKRPRFDSRSRRSYNDAGYEAELERVRYLLVAATMRSRDCRYDKGAVAVDLTFRRATRAAVDVDNLVKTVLDAAKNIVWHDDAQVTILRAEKVLGVGKADAGTQLRVSAIQ